MGVDALETDRGPEQAGKLSPLGWALAVAATVWCVYGGIIVIVTRQARPGAGFGGGRVTLEPAWAWATGLAMIAAGVAVTPLAYFAAKRHRPRLGQVELTRRVVSLDATFVLAIMAALLAGSVIGAQAMPGRWGVLFLAVLATAFAVYKVVRLVLEYRVGVSVASGNRGGPDYERSAHPVAYWWAMGIEAAWLTIGAGLAVLLWVVFASA